VFVVGHLGDWKPAAEVLFESESLRGDIKKGRGERKDIANCLTKSPSSYSSFNPARGEGNAVIARVYENHPSDSRVKEMGEVCQTVTSSWGTGGGNIPFVQNISIIGGQHPNAAISENISPTLTNAMGKGGGHVPCVAQQPIPEYYAHQYCQDRVYSTEGITPALNCSQAHKFRFDMAVRRLTPVECERLQGFPDNYTNIKENCPDGSRYKALGNSMAVPVMRWIGKRIDGYEQRGVA
jgi:DNA (cytosine-5)-methyltransferase 1